MWGASCNKLRSGVVGWVVAFCLRAPTVQGSGKWHKMLWGTGGGDDQKWLEMVVWESGRWEK